MLTLTSPVETPLHRIRAPAKLAALCLFTILLFRLDQPLALAIALGLVALVHLTQGAAFAAHALRLLRPLWPFVLVVALWHLWLREVTSGSAILLRLVTAVAAANLVALPTGGRAFVAVATDPVNAVIAAGAAGATKRPLLLLPGGATGSAAVTNYLTARAVAGTAVVASTAVVPATVLATPATEPRESAKRSSP